VTIRSSLSLTSLLLAALMLCGCGYYNGARWPVLKQNPVPKETPAKLSVPPAEAAPPFTPPGGGKTIGSLDEAVTRLSDDWASLARFRQRADDEAAAIDIHPKTSDAWGLSQIAVSRLQRSESDFSSLAEAVARDRMALEALKADPWMIDAYETLAVDVKAVGETINGRRTAAEAALAANRPSERAEPPTAPAEALPKGPAALTVAPDAEAGEIADALQTLVQKAQAINPMTVYHVVASPGTVAEERAATVRSLLQRAGVAPARIKMSTDRSAAVGSLRVYVE